VIEVSLGKAKESVTGKITVQQEKLSYTQNMVRLLLALIFSFLALLPPAGAVCCSEDVNATLPECCVSHVGSAPAVSEICCQMEGNDAVVPTLSQCTTGNEQHSYVASGSQSKLAPNWLKADNAPALGTSRIPEHLASNKIYLLKRSLLI
jgi:hypothetical protein